MREEMSLLSIFSSRIKDHYERELIIDDEKLIVDEIIYEWMNSD